MPALQDRGPACSALLTAIESTQFVFALTRGEDGLVGGRLWRSDAYGKSNWDDRTNEMEGTGMYTLSAAVEPLCCMHHASDGRCQHVCLTNLVLLSQM